ncbi:MAG: MFS transporter [Pseudomonadales bacterium]|nr:MFS transporter [Pseudomonadales bacterium]MCP5186011.1 MFS transporter [Pseudomonadales bacterium]
MTNKHSGDRLPRRTLFFFGLSDMPIQAAAVPVAAFLPNYYGADLGISLATVGTIWLFTRLFDAVSDPVIGWLSDHTNTRWGRRRVWMVAAIPVLMLAIWKLFMPQPPVTAAYLAGWLVVLWTGWTMLFIPYYAWAAELSPDYHERTRIAGWRAWLGMAANVVSKLVPVLAIYFFAFGGTRETLLLIGTMTLILLPICVLLTVANVHERRDYLPSAVSLVTGLKLMWRNAPFKRLVAAFFINQLGSAISTALVVFFIRGVLQEEQNSILMLLVYYGANLCGIPFWIWYSRRHSKHRAWATALFLFAAAQCGYLLLGAGDFYTMLPITACTGFLGGSFYSLPNAMKADVIDVDTLESGEDRAAWYFAVWSFTTKVALSLGPAVAMWVLALVGFDARPGVPSTETGLLGLHLFFVLGPALGFSLAALMVWNHTLTPEAHQVLRARIDAMRQSRKLTQE